MSDAVPPDSAEPACASGAGASNTLFSNTLTIQHISDTHAAARCRADADAPHHDRCSACKFTEEMAKPKLGVLQGQLSLPRASKGFQTQPQPLQVFEILQCEDIEVIEGIGGIETNQHLQLPRVPQC